MATLRQNEANRRNALRSTGPRTEAGKGASRFNALKHGLDAEALIIPGEDASALQELGAGYYERFQPRDPVEQYLVETLIHCDWLRRRFLRIQADIFQGLEDDGPLDPLRKAARRGFFGPDSVHRIMRQLATLDRSYLRALAELQRLQQEPQPLVEAENEAYNPASPIEQIGFVPQNTAKVGQASRPVSSIAAPNVILRPPNLRNPASG